VPKSHAATQIRYPPYGKTTIQPVTTAKWTNVRGSRKTQGADESGFSNPESATRIRHDLELLDEIIQKGFKTLSLNDAVIQRMEDVT
jgi:hypothetical protein